MYNYILGTVFLIMLLFSIIGLYKILKQIDKK